MKKRYLLIPVALLIGVMVFLSVTQDEYPNKRAVTSQQTAHTVKPTPQPPTKESLLVAVNAERAKYGAPALVEDARLDASAQAKCEDLVKYHYFEHVNPVSGEHGVTLAEKAYANEDAYYAENLVQNSESTAQMIYSWAQSKPHHDAMIDPHYTETGFGVCNGNGVEHFYGPR